MNWIPPAVICISMEEERSGILDEEVVDDVYIPKDSIAALTVTAIRLAHMITQRNMIRSWFTSHVSPVFSS